MIVTCRIHGRVEAGLDSNLNAWCPHCYRKAVNDWTSQTDPQPHSRTVRLSTSQMARLQAAGWKPGEGAIGEWLVSRAEALTVTDPVAMSEEAVAWFREVYDEIFGDVANLEQARERAAMTPAELAAIEERQAEVMAENKRDLEERARAYAAERARLERMAQDYDVKHADDVLGAWALLPDEIQKRAAISVTDDGYPTIEWTAGGEVRCEGFAIFYGPQVGWGLTLETADGLEVQLENATRARLVETVSLAREWR